MYAETAQLSAVCASRGLRTGPPTDIRRQIERKKRRSEKHAYDIEEKQKPMALIIEPDSIPWVCQKHNWKEHKPICQRLAYNYSRPKNRIAPARALVRAPGPWEYPPTTKDVMHTTAEVGLDQYQFMKLESEGAALFLKTPGHTHSNKREMHE